MDPEHGATLKSSGGRAWTRRPTTGWTRPAPSRPTHTIQADTGDRYVVCDGHALTARTQITDGQVLSDA
ncbi:hypothetical protein [Streptomyces microflavus]|uniref:hypothetical protein n=1 Tax=Streptomyces microflavus TaxID=1919 RepID=UPI0037FA2FC8